MINIKQLKKFKEQNQKITMLTCYDFSFATLLEKCGVDIILVGDSLGMTQAGFNSTLKVSLKQICYHTENVVRGAPNTFIMSDMPFGTYQSSPQDAFKNAAKLLEAGANMIKIEGGAYLAPTIEFLKTRGVPICAHIGLTPQYINTLGEYKVQGKNEEGEIILADAQKLEQAGVDLLVIECVPAVLGEEITATLKIPTIGIGAGVNCSGQVMVLQDILDIYPGKKSKFVKNFMLGASSIENAIQNYIFEVKSQKFPSEEHSY